jgi:resuscitation-promoting factor RpfA
MDASFAARTGRLLGRFAVVGAVTLGTPFLLSGVADGAPKGHWDRLAKCESGGNWSISTGNGYYGGLQFSKATWKAYGGSGMPHKASRAQQIKVAERVLKAQGWRAWPACSRKLGMRR